MASNREAVLMSVNLDVNTAIANQAKFEAAMKSSAKRIAADKMTWWDEAIARGVAAEEAAAVKAVEIHEAELKAKAFADNAFFAAQAAKYEEQAAIAAIAQGSIPSNMAGGAAARRAEGEIARDSEGILAGATGGAINGRAARGFFTTIRETILGSSRAWWSAARLATVEVSATVAAWAAAILLPLAVIVGPSAYRTYGARKAEQESEKDLAKKQRDDSEILRQRIDAMVHSKVIDKEQAEGFKQRMDASPVGMLHVLTEVNALAPQEAKTEAAEKALDLERESYKNSTDAAKSARENATAAERLVDDKLQVAEIQARINNLDQDAIGYADMKQQLEEEFYDAQHDQNEDQKKADEEKKQKQKEINEEKIKGLELQKSEIEKSEQQQKDDLKLPSLDEFANGAGYYTVEGRGRNRKRVHHTFTDDLAKQYGAGGIYDLTNGPLAADARDYLRGQYQMTYDYEDFNAETGKGYQDFLASEQGKSDTDYLSKLRAPLATAGVLSQAELLKSIDFSINQLRSTLDGLPVTIWSK
jgi:hypothetical protein